MVLLKGTAALLYALSLWIADAKTSSYTASSWKNATRHNNGSAIYSPLFEIPSNSTPRFQNVSRVDVNPLNQAASFLSISKRQSNGLPEGTCAPGVPCANGACCNNNGVCGYSPDYCGTDVCISNCDAKAECGQYAPTGKQECPLNVCCSEFGFCGTTDEFCGDGCQEAAGSCGPTPSPKKGGNHGGRKQIAYYESWATTRPCDVVEPEDLELTGITHLNFAFAFFDPRTFTLTAMDANADSLLARFTNLKTRYSSIETWIAVGGWSFNDETNVPNTRTAFSDMASTAAGRKAFIDSAIHFMRNYGFDGLDIDWEYPGADDRGGREYDRANFVLLCKELKAAFGNKYGLSVTLPASYWYLRHFDVKGMEPYVDWFNVMTYDIHGVWDSSSRFTGPYARPHTNLTQIDEGLSLLWRAGVSAGNVVLGLGWYGRSFKLADPSCNRPGCPFSEGAAAGECSGTSGVLIQSEIERIIEDNNVTPQFDENAAVKWITWNGDQWVSYDDTETFRLKIDYANRLGLGGTMIWAIDQGSKETIAKAGMFFENSALSKDVYDQAQKETQAAESCYTTFCGGKCAAGYTPVTQSRGRIGELGAATACQGNEVQTLCCLSSMRLGRCDWYGWRGEGLSCSGGCPADHTFLASNTNHYFNFPEQKYKEDKWCNGGSQSYCCNGVQVHSKTHAVDHVLIEQSDLESDPKSLQARSAATCALWGVIAGGVFVFAEVITAGTITLAGGAVIAAGSSIVTNICAKQEMDKAAMGVLVRGYHPMTTRKRPATNPPPQTNNKNIKKQKQVGPNKQYGRYLQVTYDPAVHQTCHCTYTCEFGLGFDQVCDNQRWGLSSVVSMTVFNYIQNGYRPPRVKAQWFGHHHTQYRASFGQSGSDDPSGIRGRCELDEFPLDSLLEAGPPYDRQALRQINGNENGRGGADWQAWLSASWFPCSALLQAPPPITWSIGTPDPNDAGRNRATGVIEKFGFDSSSGLAACFATLPLPLPGGEIPDHGFRVWSNDPLITHYNNPSQNYSPNPMTIASSDRPTSVNSAAFMKRELGPQYAFTGNATSVAEPVVQAAPFEVDAVATTGPVAETGRGLDAGSAKATAARAVTNGQSATQTAGSPFVTRDFVEPVPTFGATGEREARQHFHKYYSVRKAGHKRDSRQRRRHAGHPHDRKIGD